MIWSVCFLGGKENVSPLQLISEWPEEDEAKFIKDLKEAFQKAGTQVKDVNSITLPENLVFINEQQIGDTICSHPVGFIVLTTKFCAV